VCNLGSRCATQVLFSTFIILLIVERLQSYEKEILVYSSEKQRHEVRLMSLAAAVDLNPCDSVWNRVQASEEDCCHCATDVLGFPLPPHPTLVISKAF